MKIFGPGHGYISISLENLIFVMVLDKNPRIVILKYKAGNPSF